MIKLIKIYDVSTIIALPAYVESKITILIHVTLIERLIKVHKHISHVLVFRGWIFGKQANTIFSSES
jgi:hypothetical protein